MSERILIPLDGSKLGEAVLSYVNDFISRLAPGEQVEVTLFHAITGVRHSISYQGGGSISVPYTDEQLEEMKSHALKYLQRAGEQLQEKRIKFVYKVAVNPNPAEAIIEAEEETQANLVAMSTHGRGGITRFAIGSVADKVMRGGGVPVLMVRASEE